MKELSIEELSQIKGGAYSPWTTCDLVIIAGNNADDTWTEEMWDYWESLYRKLCLGIEDLA